MDHAQRYLASIGIESSVLDQLRALDGSRRDRRIVAQQVVRRLIENMDRLEDRLVERVGEGTSPLTELVTAIEQFLETGRAKELPLGKLETLRRAHVALRSELREGER